MSVVGSIGDQVLDFFIIGIQLYVRLSLYLLVRGTRDSRATLMPIYGDLYQIKL